MSMKKWPVVVDRSVTQPSRVRLTPAPEAGSNAYDLVPAPGAVLSEGTLINQALFHGMQCYIDQNDLPVIHLSSEDRVNFVGQVTLPVAIRDAVVDSTSGFMMVQPPAPRFDNGTYGSLGFTVLRADALTVEGRLPTGSNITAQKVKAQIIIPVAQGANP